MSAFLEEYGRIILVIIIIAGLLALGGLMWHYFSESGNLRAGRMAASQDTNKDLIRNSVRDAERFSEPMPKTLVYNGQNQELVFAGSSTKGTVMYSVNGSAYSSSLPSAMNVGHYVVAYKTVYADGSETTEKKIDSDIIKGTADIGSEPKVKSLIYNGSSQAVADSGASSDGKWVYSLDGVNFTEQIPMVVDAGGYWLYYQFIGDENHNSMPVQKVAFNVDYEWSNSMASPKANVLNYSGYAQELVQPGAVDSGTMVYSLDGVTFDAGIPTAVNAGTYNVYYKIVGDPSRLSENVGCVSVTIAKVAAVITTAPAARDLSFTGNPQQLISPGVADGGVLQYCLNGGELSENIPCGINAGSYGIFYKVFGDANHYDSEISSVMASIGKTSTNCTPPTGKTLAYTGEEQVLIEPGSTTFGTMEYSLDGNMFSDKLPKVTNAGDYTVWYRVLGDDNHGDIPKSSIKATVNKAKSEYTMPEVIKDLIWNGKEQVLCTYGDSKHGMFMYSLDSSNWSKVVPQAKDAGDYTVYCKFVGDTNHEDAGVFNLSTSIAALKKIKVSTQNGYAVFESEMTNGGASVTVIEPEDDYDLKFGLNEGEYDRKSIPLFDEAGLYTVYYQVEAYGYETLTGSIDIIIDNAEPTYTVTPAERLTYNGKPQNLVFYSESDHCKILYSLDGTNYSEDIPVATNAGNYIVYYSIESDPNYKHIDGVQEFEVTINKAKGDLQIPEVFDDLTYNGKNQQLFYDACTSKTGKVEYSLDNEHYSTSIPFGCDAGDYKVYVRVISKNDNYDDVYPEEYEDGTAVINPFVIRINKAKIDYTAPIPVEGLSYKNQEYELIEPATANVGTIEYRLKDTEYSQSIPKAKNAGTYLVYWRVRGNDNYLDVEESTVITTIDFAKVNYTPPVPNNLTYNGQPQALFTHAKTDIGEVSYQFPASEWRPDMLYATEPGTYTVYYTIRHSDPNYAEVPIGSIQCTIKLHPYQMVKPQAKTGLVYNTLEQELILPGSSSTGTMYYSLDGYRWSSWIPTAVNAGTYKVYYYSQGRQYYDDSPRTGYVTVTIDKAEGQIDYMDGKELTRTDSYQKLVDGTRSYTGTVYYRVGRFGEWSTDIPTAKDSGTYSVWYYSKGDRNHEDTEIYEAITTITGRPGEIEPMEGKTLSKPFLFSVKLVDGTTSSTGTVYYRLGEDGEWSTDIPKAKEPGSYDIYYYSKGEGEYDDTPVYVVTSVIEDD